jgi:hypothetical protein
MEHARFTDFDQSDDILPDENWDDEIDVDDDYEAIQDPDIPPFEDEDDYLGDLAFEDEQAEIQRIYHDAHPWD